MTSWADIQRGIFAGESGGDYDALFGYSNRPGGLFSNVKPTQMTINELIDFQSPSGEYGQYVALTRPDKGRGVATPAGAYQVVGSTLRDAVQGLGLTGAEKFTPEMQDRIGRWIYEKQGVGAWQGYRGPQPDQPNGDKQMPQQAQATPPQQAQGGFWDRFAGGRLSDENTRLRLAMALQGMTTNPNQGMMAAMQGRIDENTAQRQANRTAEFLRQQPDGGPYAEMALLGYGKEALEGYQKVKAAVANPNVQSSEMLRDQSGTVMTMRDGSVRVVTVGGDTLTGDEALQFVKNANAAYTQQQHDIYGARRSGTLGADIDLGGQAAQETEEGRQRVKWANDALQDASVVQSSIVNISDAIRAIDGGAQAGIVYNMLPNITVASASLKNAMDRMGLDVIGSVTFGALSAPELKLAMETAVPRNLNPEDLRVWLNDKLVAQQKAQAGLIEAAAHFAGGGSQADYITKYKSTSAPPGAGNVASPLTPPLPDFKSMTDEELDAFIQRGGQ